jgi:hypothetical protein
MDVAARPSGLMVKIGRGSTRSRRLGCSKCKDRKEVSTDCSQMCELMPVLTHFRADML